APFQDGTFPGPVKYGYLNVGEVEHGPPELLGRTVFCLYPHQTRYVVPAGAVTPVPEEVPPGRAVLAGTVETAVNALWDAAPLVGDRVAVVGAGMVGCSVAGVLAGFPGCDVQLVDTDPSRAEVARAFGVRFASPEDAEGGCDLVVHASATDAGLARSLELLARAGEVAEGGGARVVQAGAAGAGRARSLERLAPEGEVGELAGYGDRRVSVPLGESFRPRRLAVRASQVGAGPPVRRSRRTFGDRVA